MPCTLEPWEIDWEEKEANSRKYGLHLNDAQMLTRIACEAFRNLTREQIITMSKEARDWWRVHQEHDRIKAGKKR